MNPSVHSPVRSSEAIFATNRVLKNTYILLSMTLIFSALMAALSVFVQVSPGTSLVCMIASIACLWFVLPRTANSLAGLPVTFLITGLLGFALGPMLTNYLALENGPQLIGTALGGTGAIFLALSGYVLMTRKDFSFLGGFLFVGFVVVILAAVGNIFFAIPALSLAISAAIIFIMSGFILFDTSRVIHGGETNYIMATIQLYLNIFNIFVHLLAILGIMGGDD
ncbi:MAG: Bax inhibitor-1/YccA family protein [Chromatiales bacterium]|jgi:modulator of FtsH protease|nr:Bax inhibitor-1/YccA family protein [Chromatiales bacterium]